MYISNKNDIKIGQKIFCGYDDRPFDGYGYNVGIVTDILEDHYLFTIIDLDIKNVWGLYDEPSSVANFTTEKEVIEWLR